MNPLIPISTTSRGFAIGEFKDLYGESCSIQDSSLADRNAIWLGAPAGRMHLDVHQARALIPILERFVATGSIADTSGAPEDFSATATLRAAGYDLDGVHHFALFALGWFRQSSPHEMQRVLADYMETIPPRQAGPQ